MKIRANFRRRLTLLMAGCLVLGSIQMTGFPVQASQIVGGILSEGGEAVPASVSGGDSVSAGDPAFTVGDNSGPEEENNGLEADVFSGEPQTTNAETGETYAAEDLNAYERWSKTPVELTDGKRVFTFTKQYEEYCLDLPKSLDMADCESIIVRTADQNGSLCLKVYGSDMSKELKPYYGNSGKNEYTFTPDFTGKAVCIGIMSDSASDTYPFTVQIVSISFVMKDLPGDDTTVEENYAAEDLNAYERWSKTPVELTDGKRVFTFTKQYEEYCLDLPKSLDMADCESIIVRTADQNGSLCLKVYGSDMSKELKPYYGNSGKNEYTFTPDFTGKAVCIGIMSDSASDTYPFTAQIVSISFVMKNVQDEDTSGKKVYSGETLKAYGRWNNTPVELTDGKLILSYNAQWDEYCLDLPEALDMAVCENITIRTADQNAVLAFKIYDGAKELLSEPYYNNSGKNEYSFAPNFKGKAACIGIMCSDANTVDDAFESPHTVQIVSIEFTMSGDGEEIPLGDNLIQNPNFADADNLGVWGAEQGDSVITAESAQEAIFGDIKTYGKITDRGSNYNCFAQDVTNVVKKNKEYQYSFYVMLDSVAYTGQPDEMRTVQMAPFITADGKPNYSCNLTGDKQKVLEPGVWTRFSGTFTPTWTGELDKVVVRILEQGTEYGSGPGVKGTYYVTGVELREMIVPEKEIQTDVPNLKDAVKAEMGDDFIMGVSITNSELSDDLLMQLVTKHFNAVTLGNELKPDAMFGYASTCPGTETASINGQEIQVPKLDYSRAEMTLNAIYDWNQEHPEDFIKIRGHVLVWHSQTPEWFFHEDYDANKPYVDKDTMNLRLEWYIKTVAEHFTGPDSKYRDMFYGWDVVNEAVSDSTGTYRSDQENSSWWAVYQSNEFILNAFTYANKYMPASVELYYNDYNEWFTNKRNGIVQLLKDVKAAEGARIDGMGMQGHYQTDRSPTVAEFEAAAKAYCEVVGQVQITELDMAASSSYDGTKATLEAEYERQAKRYQEIYTSVRRMKEEGFHVGNITIWGVIDKNSWLQSSSSVGGGTDGTKKQCPLLFDDNYQVKPSYWIFADPEPLMPVIHKLTVIQTAKESFAHGLEQTYTRDDTAVSFVPVWNDKGIFVQVKVADAVKDAEDKVTLYLAKADGTIVSAECLRTDAEETEGGYTAVVGIELESSLLKTAATVGFDIVVTNGSRKAAYNDTTLSQAESSEYFAIASLKPYTYIPMGTAEVDGVKEDNWKEAVTVPLTIRLGAEASAEASLMWDQENLYVFVQVQDSRLDASSSQAHEKDSLEIFIDENNHKSDAYEEDDKQYRINYLNEQSFNGTKCKEENIVSAARETDDGYIIEAAIKWTDIKPSANTEIGIELQINDAAEGQRIGTLSWYDESGLGWSSPGVFGTAVLKDYITMPDKDEAVNADVLEDIAGNLEELLEDEYAPEEFIAGYAEAFRALAAENRSSLPQETASLQELLDRYDGLMERAAGSSVTVNSTDERIPAGAGISGALLSVPSGEEALLLISRKEQEGLPGLSAYGQVCAFDVKLLAGTRELSLKTPVVLSIPIPANMASDSVTVLHFEDGDSSAPKTVEADCLDGKVIFKAEHFSTFALVSAGQTAPDTPENPAPPAASGGAGNGTYEVTADWTQITADLSKELSALKPDDAEAGVLNVITGRKLIVPAQVLQMMTDKRMVLSMNVGDGFSFSITGVDIPADIINRDLDLSVSDNRKAVPAAVIENTCKDALSYRQLSMLNRGDFGMTVNIHVALGKENAGKYANLYRYDAKTGKLVYAGSFRITDIGQAMFGARRGEDFVVTVTDAKPQGDYIVVKGDTLWHIAAKYRIHLRDLVEANPQIINRDRIYIGDQIYLP